MRISELGQDQYDDEVPDGYGDGYQIECGCWLCGMGMTVDAECPPEDAICERCRSEGAQ